MIRCLTDVRSWADNVRASRYEASAYRPSRLVEVGEPFLCTAHTRAVAALAGRRSKMKTPERGVRGLTIASQ
jgi:hypothetical protein